MFVTKTNEQNIISFLNVIIFQNYLLSSTPKFLIAYSYVTKYAPLAGMSKKERHSVTASVLEI